VTAGPQPAGGWRVHATLNLSPLSAPDRTARPYPVIAPEGA
jgi:hypothetical protein